jgi:hypothetical protein
MASVTRWQPIFRATLAATGAEKKNQAWAPFPERERSTDTAAPTDRHASTKAATSSIQVALSKSAARNQQVSSSESG